MSISLITKGKYSGLPPSKVAKKYGGGSDGGIEYVYQEPKFPRVRIESIRKDRDNINIIITKIETEEEE